MHRAVWKAAAKIVAGLSVVAALVGIRMVTAMPEGVAAGVEALERLDAELASEAGTATEGSAIAEGESADASLVTRAGAVVREQFGGSASDADGGDAMVSCRADGRMQFMRASDCAARGGLAKIVPREP